MNCASHACMRRRPDTMATMLNQRSLFCGLPLQMVQWTQVRDGSTANVMLSVPARW
jgi:hypothetical protein